MSWICQTVQFQRWYVIWSGIVKIKAKGRLRVTSKVDMKPVTCFVWWWTGQVRRRRSPSNDKGTACADGSASARYRCVLKWEGSLRIPNIVRLCEFINVYITIYNSIQFYYILSSFFDNDLTWCILMSEKHGRETMQAGCNNDASWKLEAAWKALPWPMHAQRQSVPHPDRTGRIMHGLDSWLPIYTNQATSQVGRFVHAGSPYFHIFSITFPYSIDGAQSHYSTGFMYTHLSNNQIGTTCHDMWVNTPGWSVFIGSIHKAFCCMPLSLLEGDLEDVRRKMENTEAVKLSQPVMIGGQYCMNVV